MGQKPTNTAGNRENREAEERYRKGVRETTKETSEEERERGLRLGAMGALVKPLKSRDPLDEAFARIRRVIESPARSILIACGDPALRTFERGGHDRVQRRGGPVGSGGGGGPPHPPRHHSHPSGASGGTESGDDLAHHLPDAPPPGARGGGEKGEGAPEAGAKGGERARAGRAAEAGELQAAVGRRGLEESFARFARTPELTRLRTHLDGVDPDEVLSRVPYEKGYLFLCAIEAAVGRDALA